MNITEKYYNCNYCGRQQCNGDTRRDKRGSIRSTVTCPGWQKPYPMKTSLLERAAENPGSFTALNIILEQMNMTFHETHKYPYFTFYMN